MKNSKIIYLKLLCCLPCIICNAQFNPVDIEPLVITTNDKTLAESSIFISRENPNNIVVGNNAFDNGSGPGQKNNLNVMFSDNKGLSWNGSFFFQNEAFADPYCAIDKNGRIYVSYIIQYPHNEINLRYSDDNGATWSLPIIIASATGIDKPFIFIDNRRVNNSNAIYCAYREQSNLHVYITKSSINNLNTWSPSQELWNSNLGGAAHQAPNIAIGPEGNIYVAWSIYDTFTIFRDESAIGFAKSTDNGTTWLMNRVDFDTDYNPLNPNLIPLVIKGIGTDDGAFQSKAGSRHPSFPSMAVNQQNGNIYIAWVNRGLPPYNINQNSKDICIIKSNDNGIYWSAPEMIFTDPSTPLDQWQPYMACDPYSGTLSVVYYNSVNFINNNAFDTYNSISMDDGVTWQHYKISDNASATIQLPNYIAHDYNGNDLCNGLGIPAWCDGRNGFQTVYTQPYEIPCTTDLDLCDPVTPYYKIEKAQNDISVAQNCAYNIPPTTDIRMFAGNSIHLNSGFHASAGSKFHAAINANCVPENVQRISNNVLMNKQSQYKNSKTILSINPNPVIDELNISLTNLNTETVTIRIYAIDSKKTEIILENFSVKNLSSANFSFSVKTLNLKAGIYLIEAILNSEVLTSKIIIQ